jgi:glycosyltransferase involved in cell wall biosynthesis
VTSASAGTEASVAINGRAAVRRQIGGVERFAREMALRLPRLRPDRYRLIRPPVALAHRAGHAWEQLVLPGKCRGDALLYSPANLAPILCPRNAVVIHDVAALRYPEAYSRAYVAYQRRLLPRIAQRARILLTVSEFSRDELVDVLGVAVERVRVIPEGVDERFRPSADVASVRSRHGLDRPYVLALGTASARKNVSILDRLAPALRERGLELVLAGSDRGYLRGSVTSVRRLGYVSELDLPALYAGARAFVMPSLYEGFGLPCLEAMACGTPVVAADAGALPETCGDAAVIVPADDVAATVDALLTTCLQEEQRAHMIQAGLRRAAEFPWSGTAAGTDAVLFELLHDG